MTIIDAHAHLWKKQNGRIGQKPVVSLSNGKSDVGGTIRQMMPPYMTENTAEIFLSNMDYARVSAAVITQEIPADCSVACSTMLLPHLCNRTTVYETYYHKPAENEKLDYIILDARSEVEKPLETYQALGYRIIKTVECDGNNLLVILK